MRSSRASSVLAHAAGLGVILWVLYPVFFHAWVLVPAPSEEAVAALRTRPGVQRLGAVAAQRPLGPKAPDGADAVATADRWLAASRRGDAVHPLRSTLRPEDFAHGSGIGALPFASLHAADVLVAAYASGGRAEHLKAALGSILAFARFERSAWRDAGLLWNDHAVAARVGVVLRFWKVWRDHPTFEPRAAADLLQHVARCAVLLARPSHFTAWSNHGVMQNIALLQLAEAFPDLVDAAALRRIALERLRLQWNYYISAEGVVLEHSAGYHAEGLSLLTLASELIRLQGEPLPPGWDEQLQRGGAFLSDITRPDGTLPAFGDTYVAVPETALRGRASNASSVDTRLWPVSGYALVRAWDEPAAVSSHAMLTWSYFRGHAHKHADEPGLVLWAAGRAWITPSGYAPYSSEQRTSVEGWLGSNAPHGLGEAVDPRRGARLLGSASGSRWTVLDLERANPDGGAVFRRQFVQPSGCSWLVIDHAARVGREVETVWTFMPDLTLSRVTADSYRLVAPDGASMRVHLSGSARPRSSVHIGSREPMLGWTAGPKGLAPSATLRVLSASDGWTAAIFELEGCGDGSTLRVDAPGRWAASGSGWRLGRDDARIVFARDAGGVEQARLAAPPDVRTSAASIGGALGKALTAYPKYRNLDHYRQRMAALLGTLWLALLAATTAMRRWTRVTFFSGPRWAVALVAGWGGIALWLQWSYFAT